MKWPTNWPLRRKLSLAALAATCVGLIVTAVVGASDAVVFYRTPTEAAQSSSNDAHLRVGGLVVRGSVVESDTQSTFAITDGATEITVSYPGHLPATVHEGEGALVDGRWDSDGMLRGDEILLRHSNEYRAPVQGVP